MENLIEENLDININSSLFSPLSMEEKKSEDVIRPSVGYWANAWRRLNENKVALFSLVMIVIIILFAIFGPILIEKLYGFTSQQIKQLLIYGQMLNIGLVLIT